MCKRLHILNRVQIGDEARIGALVHMHEFGVVFDPRGRRLAIFQEAVDRAGDRQYYDSLPLDISPPTDDRPFFFQNVRAFTPLDPLVGATISLEDVRRAHELMDTAGTVGKIVLTCT